LVFAEETDTFSWGSFFGLDLWGWTILEEGVDFGEDVWGDNQVVNWVGRRSGFALGLRLWLRLEFRLEMRLGWCGVHCV
jgi:hypothetical protein